MQASQLFRRGIVCPLDMYSEEQLRHNNLDESTRIEYLAIPSPNCFQILWDSQLFAEINSRCGTLIDDFEEEFVKSDALGGVIDAAKNQMNSPKVREQIELHEFLLKLVQLANKARSENRPLLFVL